VYKVESATARQGNHQQGEIAMNEATMWWVLTGVLVALELVTGTFYLLMLGLGTVAAALVAMAGHGVTAQLVAAAIVGGVGAVLLAQWRKRQTSTRQDAHNQHLDLGATVQVDAWDDLGTAQVMHRGAAWTAVLAVGQTAAPGAHRIQAMAGNRLVLEKI
jgi:membrane protein implicated in regulation of membrane protease activity